MSSRFEQIIEDAEKSGYPYVITRDGKPIAVLCPLETWRSLTEHPLLSIENVVDTVYAYRLVIDRLLDGWQAPLAEVDELYGWWVDQPIYEPDDPNYRDSQEMTRAEQVVVYDRVVRPEAPAWPDDR